MRPVLHGDLTALARHLLTLPRAMRQGTCARIIAEADAADRYRKRFGRLHPKWGNGTLMAAARRRVLANEPPLHHEDYARCLILVLAALAERRQAARLNQRR